MSDKNTTPKLTQVQEEPSTLPDSDYPASPNTGSDDAGLFLPLIHVQLQEQEGRHPSDGKPAARRLAYPPKRLRLLL